MKISKGELGLELKYFLEGKTIPVSSYQISPRISKEISNYIRFQTPPNHESLILWILNRTEITCEAEPKFHFGGISNFTQNIPELVSNQLHVQNLETKTYHLDDTDVELDQNIPNSRTWSKWSSNPSICSVSLGFPQSFATTADSRYKLDPTFDSQNLSLSGPFSRSLSQPRSRNVLSASMSQLKLETGSLKESLCRETERRRIGTRLMAPQTLDTFRLALEVEKERKELLSAKEALHHSQEVASVRSALSSSFHRSRSQSSLETHRKQAWEKEALEELKVLRSERKEVEGQLVRQRREEHQRAQMLRKSSAPNNCADTVNGRGIGQYRGPYFGPGPLPPAPVNLSLSVSISGTPLMSRDRSGVGPNRPRTSTRPLSSQSLSSSLLTPHTSSTHLPQSSFLPSAPSVSPSISPALNSALRKIWSAETNASLYHTDSRSLFMVESGVLGSGAEFPLENTEPRLEHATLLLGRREVMTGLSSLGVRLSREEMDSLLQIFQPQSHSPRETRERDGWTGREAENWEVEEDSNRDSHRPVESEADQIPRTRTPLIVPCYEFLWRVFERRRLRKLWLRRCIGVGKGRDKGGSGFGSGRGSEDEKDEHVPATLPVALANRFASFFSTHFAEYKLQAKIRLNSTASPTRSSPSPRRRSSSPSITSSSSPRDIHPPPPPPPQILSSQFLSLKTGSMGWEVWGPGLIFPRGSLLSFLSSLGVELALPLGSPSEDYGKTGKLKPRNNEENEDEASDPNPINGRTLSGWAEWVVERLLWMVRGGEEQEKGREGQSCSISTGKGDAVSEYLREVQRRERLKEKQGGRRTKSEKELMERVRRRRDTLTPLFFFFQSLDRILREDPMKGAVEILEVEKECKEGSIWSEFERSERMKEWDIPNDSASIFPPSDSSFHPELVEDYYSDQGSVDQDQDQDQETD